MGRTDCSSPSDIEQSRSQAQQEEISLCCGVRLKPVLLDYYIQKESSPQRRSLEGHIACGSSGEPRVTDTWFGKGHVLPSQKSQCSSSTKAAITARDWKPFLLEHHMKFNVLNLFHTPTALELAQRDLEDAKRLLLEQQAVAEHAAKMVEFYEGMIARLINYVQAETKTSN